MKLIGQRLKDEPPRIIIFQLARGFQHFSKFLSDALIAFAAAST
jgi:hypothetical protein